MSRMGLPEPSGLRGAKPDSKADTFPIISEFERRDMDRALELMSDDLGYQEQEQAVRAARAAIHTELAALADKYGAPGMRWGSLATYCGGWTAKRSLNAALLVEAGVSVDVVQACYKEGKPYRSVRVVDLSKPKEKRSGGGEHGEQEE